MGEGYLAGADGPGRAGTAAGDDGAADALLDRAARLQADHATYYGTAWVGLGRVMLQTDWLGRCDGAPTT